MIRATTLTDDDVLKALQEQIRQTPRRMRSRIQRAASRTASQLLKDARDSEPAQRPQLPFVWSTNPAANARARRWYFANMVDKNRWRERYERTGRLIQAFVTRINVEDLAGLVVLENDIPGAAYVVGDRQVPSHIRTGWPNIDDLVIEASERLQDELIQAWFDVTVEGQD
jgi:hypothetical protein